MKIKIIGTGSSIPKLRVTNEDLSKRLDTSDEWIKSRTGIEARHLAIEETTTGMAAEAVRNAMEQAGVTADEIELIVAATVTPDQYLPCLACEIQSAIGADRAVAFDVNAACSGFLFALNTAQMYLQNGIYKKALVIGAETLSRIMNWEDRSTCVLFGDGAGAVVLSAEEDNAGIITFLQGSDGARGGVLSCRNRLTRHLFLENDTALDYVHMNGQEVYKFAVRTVPHAIEDVLQKAGLAPEDISLFLLHQANIRIIEAVAKRLGQPMEKFPTNLEECGNISSASVPILLDSVNRQGMIKRGDKIVLAGFGAGLTWGATVLTW